MVARRLVASLVQGRPRGCSAAPGLHQQYGTRTAGQQGHYCTRTAGLQGHQYSTRTAGQQGPNSTRTSGLQSHQYSTGPRIEDKLEEYCSMVPTPLSIAEFIERGRCARG